MKVIQQKITFEFSEKEKESFETIKEVIDEISESMYSKDYCIYFPSADDEYYADNIKYLGEILNDLLTQNYKTF